MATSRSSARRAEPSSRAAPARSAPSARPLALPATTRAAAAFRRTTLRKAPGAPASRSRIAAALSAGSPPFSAAASARSRPASSGVTVNRETDSVLQLGNRGGAGGREFVHPVGAVDDPRALRPQRAEHRRQRLQPPFGEHPDELPLRSRRIGKRPEEVKDRARAEFDSGAGRRAASRRDGAAPSENRFRRSPAILRPAPCRPRH